VFTPTSSKGASCASFLARNPRCGERHYKAVQGRTSGLVVGNDVAITIDVEVTRKADAAPAK